MKLIFFGGVQGVGKTTILSWLMHQFGNRLRFLDPGDLFRRYFYNERIKTTEEIEELIVDELAKMPDDATVIIHWHYAVRRPSGYISQINSARLRRIAESGRIERAVLLMVQAPIEVVSKRRLQDYASKKREVSCSAIHEEMDADEKFLAQQHALFSEVLGGSKVTVVRLTNNDLAVAKSKLYVLLKTLMG